jgi:biopolymer transport protein ExbD/biopolymer transport protein TolR
MHLVAKQRRRLVDEINITPLTDVFLVLLIIMMVVAPLMHEMRQGIKPPKVAGGADLSEVQMMIEVDNMGIYYVNSEKTAEDQLAAKLQAEMAKLGAGTPLENMVIRADKMTKCKAVLKVYDAAREAQFKNMTVVIENLTDERAKTLGEKNAEAPVPDSQPVEGALPIVTPPVVAPEPGQTGKAGVQ